MSLTPATALTAPAVAAINHLLAQEAWARDALALHANKLACIDTGALVLRVRVARDGMLEGGEAGGQANVTIRLKLSDLPLILQDRERAFSHVRIEGDADFANTLSQVAKGLRWEAEHDLEPWIGAVAARRLAGGARGVVDAARSTHQKLAENVAEFFLDEQPLLVRPSMVEEFGSEVSRLRDDVERSAKRIARLEQALAGRGDTPATVHRSGQPTLDKQ